VARRSQIGCRPSRRKRSTRGAHLVNERRICRERRAAIVRSSRHVKRAAILASTYSTLPPDIIAGSTADGRPRKCNPIR